MVLLFFEFLRLILIFIFMEYGRRQERHIQQKSVGIIEILLFIWIPLPDPWQTPFRTFGSIFQPQWCRLEVKMTTNEGDNCEW